MSTRLILFIVGASLALTVAVALAVDVEVGDESQIRPVREIPPPPPLRGSEVPIRNLIASVRVGDPVHCDGFAVYPLLLDAPRLRTSMLTLDEALDRKLLEIREKGSGNVPTLTVTNRSRRYVFLMAGEMILGGKQNRLLRQDVILPPGIRDMEIPVYCGQQGRWSETSPTFESKSSIANLDVRKKVMAQKGQSEVWSGISDNLAGNEVADGSQSLQAAFEDKEVKRRIKRMTADCPLPKGKNVVGIAVMRYGRVLGADLFGEHGLLRKLYDKIIATYAVEIFDEPVKDWRNPDQRGEVERFLAQLADASMRPIPSPGAGQAFILRSGGIEGGAIALGGEPVHAAALH